MASVRRRENKIVKLQDDDGIWWSDQQDISRVTVDYFQNLFRKCGNQAVLNLDYVGRRVSSDQNDKLVAPFQLEEFTRAIRHMHTDKSPGPDSFNPAFFQHFWDLIGSHIYQSCVGWLDQTHFPSNLNNRTIVLIPKTENPSSMKDFRPIGLCNVLDDILAKVLANSLKAILPSIIDESPSAFVPGRSITNNVIAAFEIIHHMKSKRHGNSGETED